MKKLTSRQKILFGVYGNILFMIGDYLLGFGTIGTSSASDAVYGMSWNVAPDWRYAWSSILGFIGAAMFGFATIELIRVMEQRDALKRSAFYRLFKIAVCSGVLYFAFIHISMSMLPVVFNAGMDAVSDKLLAIDMAVRVAKSIAVPLIAGFLLCDGFVVAGWIGMVLKGQLPVKKIALICNPVIMALIGQLFNLIAEGLDSGFESLGWALMYLVCALRLAEEENVINSSLFTC